MHARPLASALGVFFAVSVVFPFAAFSQTGILTDAEWVKASAGTFQRSPKTKVVVKLKDGRTHRGRITSTGDDRFTLFDLKDRREVEIRYDSVSELRRRGISKGAKAAIWVGVGVGVGALIIFGPRSSPIGTICPLGCPR